MFRSESVTSYHELEKTKHVEILGIVYSIQGFLGINPRGVGFFFLANLRTVPKNRVSDK